MSPSASTRQASALRGTEQGTIVGMPPVVRDPSALGQQCSTTLRSVYSPEELESRAEPPPCSDPFHPDRWSAPPPIGSDPIIPCDDPDDDEPIRVISTLEIRSRAPGPAPTFVDEADPPTLQWGKPAEEPLPLPMGALCSEPDGRLLVLAGLASCAALVMAASAALLWL